MLHSRIKGKKRLHIKQVNEKHTKVNDTRIHTLTKKKKTHTDTRNHIPGPLLRSLNIEGELCSGPESTDTTHFS